MEEGQKRKGREAKAIAVFPFLLPLSSFPYDSRVEVIQPYIGQLSFGGIAGFATGFAIKKIGRVLAVTLGLIFIVVQVLASMGYISVDWTRIQKDVEPILGQDRLKGIWEALVSVLTNNLPFAGAFVAGLLIGLRAG